MARIGGTLTQMEVERLEASIAAVVAEVRTGGTRIGKIETAMAVADERRDVASKAMDRMEADLKAHRAESSAKLDALDAKLDAAAKSGWSAKDVAAVLVPLMTGIAMVAGALTGNVPNLQQQQPIPPYEYHAPVPNPISPVAP